MKKKRLMLCIACVSVLAALCGCGKQEQAELAEATETEVERDIGDTSKVEADIKNMEEWEGTWRSFAEYCNDEKMQDAWGDIADAFELQEEQLKSTFDSLCFITDDVVKLEIKDGVVTAYDTTADEDAGNFKYLCMMPICTLEDSDNGLELAGHFHFNYGSTMEKATNRSGIPSMVDDDITEEEKLQTLCGFFLGSKNEE